MTGRQVAFMRCVVVEPPVPGLDRQAPSVGHRVAGVDSQVQQRILELVRVDQRGPEAARPHRLDGDRGADGSPDQLLHPGHQPIDVGRLGVERLSPREGQQAMGQRSRPLCSSLRRGDVAVDVIHPALDDTSAQQLQAAADAGQEIVEVVRQPARELTHSLHLLRLPQRVFDPLALGNFADEVGIGVGQLAQVQLLLGQIGQHPAQQSRPVLAAQRA